MAGKAPPGIGPLAACPKIAAAVPPEPPVSSPRDRRRDALRLVAASAGCVGAAAIAALLAYGLWSLLL